MDAQNVEVGIFCEHLTLGFSTTTTRSVRLSEPSRSVADAITDKSFRSFYVKYLPLIGLKLLIEFKRSEFAWSGDNPQSVSHHVECGHCPETLALRD